MKSFRAIAVLVLPALAGCGDRCEDLCQDLSRELDRCMPDSMSWADLGARNRVEYAAECERDWDQASTGLTSHELELALDLCLQTREDLENWSCDEILALYGL